MVFLCTHHNNFMAVKVAGPLGMVLLSLLHGIYFKCQNVTSIERRVVACTSALQPHGHQLRTISCKKKDC